MKALKLLFAAAAAVMMTFTALAGNATWQLASGQAFRGDGQACLYQTYTDNDSADWYTVDLGDVVSAFANGTLDISNPPRSTGYSGASGVKGPADVVDGVFAPQATTLGNMNDWYFSLVALVKVNGQDMLYVSGLNEKGGEGKYTTLLEFSLGTAEYDAIGGYQGKGYYRLPAPTAKAVVADGGTTLKFVYDTADYGAKGTDWFSVAEAEAIDSSDGTQPWYGASLKFTSVIIDSSFKDYKPKQCALWFYYMRNVTAITGLENLDTSAATDMKLMFGRCSSIPSLDLGTFDTSNVTNTESMFQYCSKLGKVVVSGAFDMSKVEKSTGMFTGCTNLVGGAGTVFDKTHTDKSYARIDGGPSSATPGYFTEKEKIARVQVEDGGKTLRFVYDSATPSGTKDMDWFSVADAEAIDPDYEDVPWGSEAGSVTKVVFDESFASYQPAQCGRWFYYFTELETVEGIGNLDTSKVMSMKNMFFHCLSLKALDVSGFDTANVSDMSCMFAECQALESLDVSGFATANVTVMASMFEECFSLTSLDVSGFDTAKVTNMSGMFKGCCSLTSLDVSGFATANVTQMIDMFCNCQSLESLDVSGFNTAEAKTLFGMFSECVLLTSLDLTGFDTAKVTHMSDMFYECSSLETIIVSEKFVTTKVTSSDDMFCDCWALVGGKGTEYDPSYVDKTYARIDGGTSAPGYFAAKGGATAKAVLEDGGTTLRFVYDVTNYGTKDVNWFSVAEAEKIDPDADLAPWASEAGSVTKVVFDPTFAAYRPTQCACWFFDFCALESVEGIENLDTADATDMSRMFYCCYSLTSLDVSGFDTAKVTDMRSMFASCWSLESLDLTGFDTANVTDMHSMFDGCSALESLDLTGFDTAKVTNMNGMFCSCDSLKSLDLSGFDTAKVTDMGCMFEYCGELSAIYASEKFVTTQVTFSESMFYCCSELAGGKGTTFNFGTTDATYARIDGGPSAPGYFTRGADVYKIRFAANGGTGTMADQICARDKVYNLTKCAFTAPTGKAFKGWAGSNGRRYDDGVLIFNAAEEGKALTLMAIWE